MPKISTLHTSKIQWTIVFSSFLLAFGMVFSPFLLSASFWFLVAAGLWNVADVSTSLNDRTDSINDRTAFRRVFQILKIAFQNFFKNKNLVVLALLFFVPLVSGFWSETGTFFWERVRVRIPFFVLPFAFANLPRLETKHFRLIFYFFLGLIFCTAAGVLVNFFQNYTEIMQNLHDGRTMPVPRGNHIRFSLLAATGVILAGWLAQKKDFWKHPRDPYFLGAAAIFLFIFLHIQSVRSGLAAIYVALVFTIFRFIFLEKRWLSGLAMLLFLGLITFTAAKTIPSLAQKISYMRWDWGKTNTAEGLHYSDSSRKTSMLAGWELAKTHPVLGVGTGDLPAEMKRVAAEKFPNYQTNIKLPHNQFLYILSATGFLGLLLSLWAFYRPLFLSKRVAGFYLFAVFQLIVFTSFLAEYTIETALGVAFFLFFQLLFMKMAEEI